MSTNPKLVELTGRFLRTREVAAPEAALRDGHLLAPGLKGPLARSFRLLRTQVLQRLRSRGWNTLAVVSPTAGDGKTTVALNLAMAISMDAAHNALLVDLDLHRPSVARRLGVDVDAHPDVVAALMGDAPVEAAFLRLTGYERLMILPARDAVAGSSELLAAPATAAMALELRRRYADRIVVYDLPPLLGADDALAFLPQVDAVLLVVSEGHTRAEDLYRAMELLKDKPIVGSVLNQSRADAEQAYP